MCFESRKKLNDLAEKGMRALTLVLVYRAYTRTHAFPTARLGIHLRIHSFLNKIENSPFFPGCVNCIIVLNYLIHAGDPSQKLVWDMHTMHYAHQI